MISIAHAAEAGAAHGPFYTTAEFWVAVAFLIVVGFAAKSVSRAIANALDVRAEKIRHKLDEARELREEAQAMLADYQRKQRDALKEAEAIIEHAKAEADREKVAATKALEDSVKRRERQALDRIAQAEASAIAEVRDLASEIAVGAARQVISDKMTAAKANSLIDDAIKELPTKLN